MTLTEKCVYIYKNRTLTTLKKHKKRTRERERSIRTPKGERATHTKKESVYICKTRTVTSARGESEQSDDLNDNRSIVVFFLYSTAAAAITRPGDEKKSTMYRKGEEGND